MSKTCILIGNGPSLRDIDMRSLADVDTLSFNRAYLSYEDEWCFDPTYYCVIDGNTIRSTVDDLKKLMLKKSKTKRFFINNVRKEFNFGDADYDRLTEFTKLNSGTYGKNMFNKYGENQPKTITDLKLITNVSAFGIGLLYTLGYDNIGIIGCDARYVQRPDVKAIGKYNSGPLKGKEKIIFTSDNDPNHYRNDYHGSDHITSHHHLNGVDGNNLSTWKTIAANVKKLGNIKVHSCTENSRMNGIFPYKPFEEFRKEYL